MESMNPDYDPLKSLTGMTFHEGEDEADCFICHPGYLDAEILRSSSLLLPRTWEVEMACSRELKDFVEREEISLVTYDDL